ncbi:hypothetical protein F5Y19DRAFT_467790 [Xylariaceae sp. FL1651]|nr:hypothetical protein F5Y19DRAFT_467790 [Xylariaceae sp. FL1651]
MASETHLPLHSVSEFETEFEIAYKEFRALQERYTRHTFNGREFILVNEITRCLRNKSESCPRWLANDLQRLLVTAHHSHYSRAPDVQLEILEKYLSIFYILIDLGCPQYIHRFHEHGLEDSCLPISKSKLEKIQMVDWGGVADFYQQFQTRQYAWCPASFDLNMDKHYSNQVIPFCRKERIGMQEGDGGRAYRDSTLWRVEIPQEQVGSALRDKLGFAKRARDDSYGDGVTMYYECVIKQFPSSKRNSWSRERKAAEALKEQSGVVRYIGWYCNLNEDPPHEEMLNIVLEPGEMDLYSFMTTREPPMTSSAVLEFWRMMLNVACGLCDIHKLQLRGLENLNYNVCHGDIKPENLLYVDGSFKIADAGEARIEISTSSENPQTSMTGGTMTYEKSRMLNHGIARNQKVSLKCDIWSLGSARGTDKLTHAILNIVDTFMLVNETDRQPASGIVKVMTDKIEDYQKLDAELPDEMGVIENMLQDINLESLALSYHSTGSIRSSKSESCYDNGATALPHLIDDFKSSRERLLSQPHATYLIRILVWRALGYDEDGMELYFTNKRPRAQVEQKVNQNVADFVRAMDAGKPSAHPSQSSGTITAALQEIFSRYNSTPNPKPMTIIVLTDGIWETVMHETAVDAMIKQQINELTWSGHDNKDLSVSRPITFQFIRFGDHPDGMKRLERLDNQIENGYYPDLVDTEPATGDVYKMFLGRATGSSSHSPVHTPSLDSQDHRSR